jgi:hypothetical protein
VWGLSTRKIFTPWSIQNRITSRSAFHSAPASSEAKSGLTMSCYFFGGFSA